MSLDQWIAAIALGIAIAWTISAVIAVAANAWLARKESIR